MPDEYLIQKSTLSAIADSIRSVLNETDEIPAISMAEKIVSIPGFLFEPYPEIESTITTLDASTPSFDILKGRHDGTGKVQINGETIVVNPTGSAQTIYPSDKSVITKVEVNGYSKQIFTGTAGMGYTTATLPSRQLDIKIDIGVEFLDNDLFIAFAGRGGGGSDAEYVSEIYRNFGADFDGVWFTDTYNNVTTHQRGESYIVTTPSGVYPDAPKVSSLSYNGSVVSFTYIRSSYRNFGLGELTWFLIR